MKIDHLLIKDNAPKHVIEWAKGKSLQEIWETCEDGCVLMWLLETLGAGSKTFQVLAVMFAESVMYQMQDERSKQAVKDARRFLNGENTGYHEKIHKSACEVYMPIRDKDEKSKFDIAAEIAMIASTSIFDNHLIRKFGDIEMMPHFAVIAAYSSTLTPNSANIIRKHISFDVIKFLIRKSLINYDMCSFPIALSILAKS